MIKHLAAIIVALAFAIQTFATDRYLSPTGTNSGAGDSGAPWLTLTYAIANASTGDPLFVSTTDLQLRTSSPGQPTAARLNNAYGAYGPQLGGYYGGN